jgi:putative NADPH-quinone reductase
LPRVSTPACSADRRAAEGKGHEVDDSISTPRLRSAAERAEERLNYHDLEPTEPVKDYVERLRAAEALVMVYPVWNYGYPAILKGFFDRVFLPGVSFALVDGKVRPTCTISRKVVVVTTYGGSRLRTFLMGDPPRKIVNRMLRVIVKPGAPVAIWPITT